MSGRLHVHVNAIVVLRLAGRIAYKCPAAIRLGSSRTWLLLYAPYDGYIISECALELGGMKIAANGSIDEGCFA